jgi:anti-sigma regulatory factor (Ser/Thr protein kinase)/PAS domain-containing protein
MNAFQTLVVAAAAFICLWASPSPAQPIPAYDDELLIPLGPRCELFEDREKALSINDIVDNSIEKTFIPLAEAVPNLGFRDASYWVKFSLAPHFSERVTMVQYYLELAHPHFDMVEVYVFDSRGGLQMLRAGDTVPFAIRAIRHRNYVFPLTLERDIRYTVYINIKSSGSFQLPLNLARADHFLDRTQKTLLAAGIFYGILFSMCLASLLLFFIELDRIYLIYLVFVVVNMLWHLSIDGFAFQFLWPDNPWWANQNIPFFIASLILVSIVFSRRFLFFRQSDRVVAMVFRWLIAAAGALCLASFMLPYAFAVRFFTMMAALVSAILIFLALYYMFKKERLASYIMIALVIYLAGTMVFALNRYGFIPKNTMSDQAHKAGSLMQIVILYFALNERIRAISREKENAVVVAEQAGKKYAIVAEESGDMIFSLDETMRLLSWNKAVKKHLKATDRKLQGVTLYDLIHNEEGREGQETLLLEGTIATLKKSGVPISFTARFKSFFSGESIPVAVRLERVSIRGKTEILGRASSIVEDALLHCFIEEKLAYSIENTLVAADEITRRMTRNLQRYAPAREAHLIRMALRELLLNAIEHGNLGISFNEKTAAIERGDYFTLLESRRLMEEHKGRKVTIQYSLWQRGVEYVIEDQGGGFNYRVYASASAATGKHGELPHGRGIAMALSVFDHIRYDRDGRRVTARKKFAGDQTRS